MKYSISIGNETEGFSVFGTDNRDDAIELVIIFMDRFNIHGMNTVFCVETMKTQLSYLDAKFTIHNDIEGSERAEITVVRNYE